MQIFYMLFMQPMTIGLIIRRSLVQVLPPQPFRVFITDLSDEHSIFLCFFIVFNLCIEQVLTCSFLLCREIFHGYALSCFEDYVFLFYGIFNNSDEAVMNNDFLCFVFPLTLNRMDFDFFNQLIQECRC